VVNVPGTTPPTWTNFGNTIAGAASDPRKQIIFNFADATTVNFNGMEVPGTVLAPRGKVSVGGWGGKFRGNIVSDSVDLQATGTFGESGLTSSYTETTTSIDGGLSWNGWTKVGNSLSLGIYAGGKLSRDFDVYIAQFKFNNESVSRNPIQTSSGWPGFSNGSGPLGFGNYAAGSFANGNTIFAIGMKMRNGSRASGNQIVNFDIDGGQFSASSVVNETLADGVWDAFGPAGQAGDFSTWMDAINNRPANLAVNNNGAGGVSNLPGGIGSGTGYNFAFRHFRQGDVNGSIQMFYDLTAMQALYGAGGSLTLAKALPGQAGGWNPSVMPIGAISSYPDFADSTCYKTILMLFRRVIRW
jgi:hypothetical protein